MFTTTFEQLDAVASTAFCARCENGIHREGCPNCGGSGTSNELVVEASSLGLAPGEWPDRIIVDRAGDLYSYVRQARVNEHGTRFYTSPGRPKLVVLND